MGALFSLVNDTRTYLWQLTANKHVFVGLVRGFINNRLYAVEKSVSLARRRKYSFSTREFSPTGNDPRHISSNETTGILRSVALGGTGLVGGVMTSS